MDLNKYKKCIIAEARKIKTVVVVKLFYWEHFGFLYFGNFMLDNEANLYLKT